MLMRTDPFRDLDRLTQQVFGGGSPMGTWSRPNPMPMDAYRSGETYVVSFDLPGLSAASSSRVRGQRRFSCSSTATPPQVHSSSAPVRKVSSSELAPTSCGVERGEAWGRGRDVRNRWHLP